MLAVRVSVVAPLLCVLACGFAGERGAGAGDPVGREVVSGPVGARLDSVLTGRSESGEDPVSATVLVARDGRVLLAKGYGYADRSEGRPNAVDLPYDIGSMTKLFTAAGILALVDEGRVDPTDTLGSFFPGAPVERRGVTLHELLTHSAGFPEYTGHDYDLAGRDAVVDAAFGPPLAFAPGHGWQYSNAGYSVLAAVIERVADVPYERFLRDRFFGPLGMDRTGYVLPAFDTARAPRAYRGDRDRGNPLTYRWLQDGPSWHLRGNGGMYSTVGDLYRWYRALQAGEALPGLLLDRYWGPGAPVDGELATYGSHYGYGWFVGRTEQGRRLVQHSGGGPMTSDMRVYPDDDAVIIVLANVQRPSAVAVSRALHEVLFTP